MPREGVLCAGRGQRARPRPPPSLPGGFGAVGWDSCALTVCGGDSGSAGCPPPKCACGGIWGGRRRDGAAQPARRPEMHQRGRAGLHSQPHGQQSAAWGCWVPLGCPLAFGVPPRL